MSACAVDQACYGIMISIQAFVMIIYPLNGDETRTLEFALNQRFGANRQTKN